MDRPYIEELRIQNYGCIRDETFRFTPLHALIGPNDSGKSTVLRALRTVSYLLRQGSDEPEGRGLRQAITGRKTQGETRFEASTRRDVWEVAFLPTAVYRYRSFSRILYRNDQPQHWSQSWPPDAALAEVAKRPAEDFVRAIQGTQLFHLEPDALRAAHALIPDGQPLRFLDERGTGLPALYDALIVRNLPAYMALSQELAKLFPSVQGIQLTTPSPGTRGMGVKLTDGEFVPSELMSEGLLYYLAFAVLPHLEPTAMLLIEEPENGLHPARIAEVMRVLRAISEKTQVIIATHSPLVVNELRPDEVTVVTRSRETGTKATLIKDTPGFEERSKVYALGELWLSYANGEDEAPLLQGGPRP
jgi:predicted ATPase